MRLLEELRSMIKTRAELWSRRETIDRGANHLFQLMTLLRTVRAAETKTDPSSGVSDADEQKQH